MAREKRKFNLGAAMLAVLIVFFMSVGAFVGAAENIVREKYIYSL